MTPKTEPNEVKQGNLQTLEGYYEGAVVSSYEHERISQASWHAESRAFEAFLDEIRLPVGARVLDLPIGTGRFLEAFSRRGFFVVGRDISSDMVASATERARGIGVKEFDIAVGDGTRMDLVDDSVDLAVSVRFLVHLELSIVDKVLGELARVCRGHVITHIRIESPGALNAAKRAISRISRKLRSRPSKKISDKAATIHSASAVKSLFVKHKLTVVRDENVNKTSKGYESHLYLLKVD